MTIQIRFSLRAKPAYDMTAMNIHCANEIHNVAEAMEMPIAGQQDGYSDYGSEFSPDEEEILDALLHQTVNQDDGPNRDPDLLLRDIEIEEGPRGARVPRRQHQQSQECLPIPLSIRLDDDNRRSTNSRCHATRPSQTSTD